MKKANLFRSCVNFGLKFCFFTLLIVFVSGAFANSDQEQEKNEDVKTYSFRPLLIQGKKRLAQKTKDLKVETDNILETQIFFTEIDFKKRIFSDEALDP